MPTRRIDVGFTRIEQSTIARQSPRGTQTSIDHTDWTRDRSTGRGKLVARNWWRGRRGPLVAVNLELEHSWVDFVELDCEPVTWHGRHD
jgi:hypothetical protein